MLHLLWIIAVVILVLWFLGLVVGHLGGLINLLVVVALILVIIWLVQRVRTRR